jgi:parallel beta-helix repeat protein/predicted outer membrane repeat protein
MQTITGSIVDSRLAYRVSHFGYRQFKPYSCFLRFFLKGMKMSSCNKIVMSDPPFNALGIIGHWVGASLTSLRRSSRHFSSSRFRHCFPAFFCAVLLVFAFSGLASAATWTVTNTSDTGAGSLRQAILDAAASGDTIVFSGLPANSTITLANTLTVDKSLTIDGSGAPGLAVSGNNAVRVFSVAGGTTVEFKDFTIKDGNVTGSGGGIDSDATLTLTRVTVSGNTATGNGGGIYNYTNGTLTLTDSTVSGNTANYGGGIYNYDSATLTLTDSTVSGNTANNGGGIYNFTNGTLTLTNSTVSGNTANTNGGGIRNDGTLTLTNSTVSGNTADSGGGIYNTGTATLTNSTVSGNTATTNGGGIRNWGTATLTNSTVFGNTDDDSLAGCSGLCNAADAFSQSTATLANTIVQSCYIESAAPPPH